MPILVRRKYPELDKISKNPVGMADLEANLAGLNCWDAYISSISSAGTPKTNFEFDICKYVTEKWDENKNPNIAADTIPAQ